MKKTTIFFFLHLNLNLIFFTNAQNFSDWKSSQDNPPANFEPSLAVVIGMLAVVFLLTFILLLYAKFCHAPPSSAVHNMTHQISDGLLRSRSQSSGVDKSIVESLPFFRFSSLRGARDGLECAVCLAKFEDIEILRLLPKCKHAFHIECIDKWLEKHATCPLCRHKVSAGDISQLSYSNSLRFLWSQSGIREDSNLELHIEREESHRIGSSSKFRKNNGKERKEEEFPITIDDDDDDEEEDKSSFHKFNHKINVVSDVTVLKSRWSNVSSSDLMFLKSEMLGDVSSSRFSSLDSGNQDHKFVENDEKLSIKEEMERRRAFESKIRGIMQSGESDSMFPRIPTTSDSKVLCPNEKRCMSEILVHSRFRSGDSGFVQNNAEEERKRTIWLPIARKTVQWFANRERIGFSHSTNTNV